MSNKPKHCLLKSFEHSRKVLGKANGSGGQNENKTGNIAQWASFKKRKQKTYTKWNETRQENKWQIAPAHDIAFQEQSSAQLLDSA